MRAVPRRTARDLHCGKVGDKEMLVAVFGTYHSKLSESHLLRDGKEASFVAGEMHFMFMLVCVAERVVRSTHHVRFTHVVIW